MSHTELLTCHKSCRSELMGGLRTGIRPTHITVASKMVSDYSGMVVQPHKAIVGANAFSHMSGVHQDGMLKSRLTYEIIDPAEIGLVRSDPAGLALGESFLLHSCDSFVYLAELHPIASVGASMCKRC